MKPDDFEKRLQNQPLRQIPTEWRAEILQSAASSPHPSRTMRRSVLSTINHQLSAVLWFNPKAWAGLAAIWVVIFALQFKSQNNSPMVAAASAPRPSTILMSLKDQQQTLAELMGNNQPNDADQTHRAAPKPHSERRRETVLI